MAWLCRDGSRNDECGTRARAWRSSWHPPLVLQALPRLVLAVAFCRLRQESDELAPRSRTAAPAPAAAPLALPAARRRSDRRASTSSTAKGGRAYDKAIARQDEDARLGRRCERAARPRSPRTRSTSTRTGCSRSRSRRRGDAAGAVDHVVTAIAGDYYQYGAELATIRLQAVPIATPHGQAVAALAQQIHDEYAKRDQGRRVARRPAQRVQVAGQAPACRPATSRGELYAYDRESKRYFRLTHTEHQVAGFVRAPSGSEVALLGFDKVDRPKADDVAAAVRARVARGRRSDRLEAARPARQPAARAWSRSATAPAISCSSATGACDRPMDLRRRGRRRRSIASTGKLDEDRRAAAGAAHRDHARRGPRRAQSDRWRRGAVDRRSADVADAQARAAAPRSRCRESGQAAQRTVAVAPDKAHVAFATAVDPCAKDAAPSLYVADAQDRRAQARADREEPVRDALDRRDDARVRRRRRRDPAVGRDDRPRGRFSSTNKRRARARRAVARERAAVQAGAAAVETGSGSAATAASPKKAARVPVNRAVMRIYPRSPRRCRPRGRRRQRSRSLAVAARARAGARARASCCARPASRPTRSCARRCRARCRPPSCSPPASTTSARSRRGAASSPPAQPRVAAGELAALGRVGDRRRPRAVDLGARRAPARPRRRSRRSAPRSAARSRTASRRSPRAPISARSRRTSSTDRSTVPR